MSEDHLTPETSTRLEQVLWMHGQYRRRLEPLGVTPLQAGLLLFLHRQADANMTETAHALCVRAPTLSEVIRDVVRKRWVTKRRSVTDTRVVHLKLSRSGLILTRKIETHVAHANGEFVPIQNRSSRSTASAEG